MSRRLLFPLCLLICLALCSPAVAAPTLQPGFRTLGIWNPDTSVRMDLAVWYPARRSPSRVDYGDWVFSASRGAAPVEGQHPLVVLSHDSAGSRFSLHALASQLARNGFVVVAPTHAHDNVDSMDTLFTAPQVTRRARQISLALDIALSHPDVAPLIDPQRIGVLGVGPGGTAALLIAGARLDSTVWPLYCAGKDEDSDPYCTPWARQRMNVFAAAPDLSASYRDRRVRAASAVAPSYAMFFTPTSLSRIRIPLQLLRAEKNRLYTLQHAERLLGSLPQPPQLGILPEADAASLMSECGPTLKQTLPGMCLGVPAARRAAVQEKMAAEAVAFFLRELGTPNPPPLPPEPEDPPIVKETPKADRPAARRRAR